MGESIVDEIDTVRSNNSVLHSARLEMRPCVSADRACNHEPKENKSFMK